mmetsp:Transcript_32659/g.93730  ORF Transcript_32659/g.93730 Transcript_32659/m.93730 type:complete len:205 (+) Transcript_32659:85-699(+)
MGQRMSGSAQVSADAQNSSAVDLEGPHRSPQEPILLRAQRGRGERYGAKLQWTLGPPSGLLLLDMLPGCALHAAAAAAGLRGRATGGTIISVNGVSGNQRLMDAEFDRSSIELLIVPSALTEDDNAPLLQTASLGDQPTGTPGPTEGAMATSLAATRAPDAPLPRTVGRCAAERADAVAGRQQSVRLPAIDGVWPYGGANGSLT